VCRYLALLFCPFTGTAPEPSGFCRLATFASDAMSGDGGPSHLSAPISSSLEARQALSIDIRSSASLKRSHVGHYYPIDESRIPEAFQQWYTHRDIKSPKSVPIEGGGAIKPLPRFVAGCAGLQHELAQSQYPYLMYRCSQTAKHFLHDEFFWGSQVAAKLSFLSCLRDLG
jgi:hypothetical protein